MPDLANALDVHELTANLVGLRRRPPQGCARTHTRLHEETTAHERAKRAAGSHQVLQVPAVQVPVIPLEQKGGGHDER